MKAYKRSNDRSCPCGKWARWEVWKDFGDGGPEAKVGDYCRSCADEIIKKIEAEIIKPTEPCDDCVKWQAENPDDCDCGMHCGCRCHDGR